MYLLFSLNISGQDAHLKYFNPLPLIFFQYHLLSNNRCEEVHTAETTRAVWWSPSFHLLGEKKDLLQQGWRELRDSYTKYVSVSLFQTWIQKWVTGHQTAKKLVPSYKNQKCLTMYFSLMVELGNSVKFLYKISYHIWIMNKLNYIEDYDEYEVGLLYVRLLTEHVITQTFLGFCLSQLYMFLHTAKRLWRLGAWREGQLHSETCIEAVPGIRRRREKGKRSH